MFINQLIFGKNNTEGIVCIEPFGDSAEIFLEKTPGEITSLFVPNKYWVLSNEQHGVGWNRLKGDLFFKYGKQFKERQTYLECRYKLKNHGFYSPFDPKEALMLKDGYTYFKGLNSKDISILSFDIETTGIKKNNNSKVLLISNTLRIGNTIERKLFCYDEYSSQGNLIESWCNWVRKVNPSIICGHNIYSFDLPYLNHVAELNNTQLVLGRNNTVLEFFRNESRFRVDGSKELHYNKIRCYGRELIDTLFLSYKYDVSRKYESYSLKSIIKEEGLEDINRQFYDASQIRFKYQNKEEWEKIKRYAEFDADDALKIYDLMINPFFYMTQSVPKPFQVMMESASGSQINAMMVRSYLQNGHSIPKADPINSFIGAISFGIPGIYKNVVKFDVASLYPSIMLQYEVYDKMKDPNGNFLNILNYFTNERLNHKRLYKETKLKYHDDMQSAGKIFINSGYGFYGATGLNFNSENCARFITEKGREILTNALKWATDLSNDEIQSLVTPKKEPNNKEINETK